MKISEMLENAKIDSITKCWNWLGKKTGRGYGFIINNGKLKSCHRLAYEEINGKIPHGLEIDHLCKNKACFNPKHLEAVTHSENIRRAEIKRAKASKCIKGHKLTGIRTRATGGRYCKICVRDSKRRQRAA